MSAVLAPGGWGWRPGADLSGQVVLPPIPEGLTGAARNAAVVEALRSMTDNRNVRVCDLVKHYGLPWVTGSVVLARARE